jgi:hypothetical protein
MGRPATGALGQYPEDVSQEISQMRKAHPGRGPLTILAELKKDARFAGERLPSRSRIAAYLKQEGLAKKYERHHELPEPKPKTVEQPHPQWQPYLVQWPQSLPGLYAAFTDRLNLIPPAWAAMPDGSLMKL